MLFSFNESTTGHLKEGRFCFSNAVKGGGQKEPVTENRRIIKMPHKYSLRNYKLMFIFLSILFYSLSFLQYLHFWWTSLLSFQTCYHMPQWSKFSYSIQTSLKTIWWEDHLWYRQIITDTFAQWSKVLIHFFFHTRTTQTASELAFLKRPALLNPFTSNWLAKRKYKIFWWSEYRV